MTRSKALIPVLVLLAAAAAYWFLLLAPKREEAAELSTQIEQAQTQLQAAEATAATYETARRGYKANYTRVAGLGKAVPADDDVRSLLVQINTTAIDHKVDFKTLEAGGQAGAASDSSAATPATPLPPGAVPFGTAGMAAMPFSFILTGRYSHLSTLMTDVERYVSMRNDKLKVSGRLMRIESVSLRQSSLQWPNLRAEIKASTYIMPATSAIEGAAETSTSADGTTPAPADPTAVPQAATITPTGAAR